MLRAIIFDFDGVILESVDIKTRAFRELFKDHPDRLEDIVQLHVQNTGVSRFEKFEIIYRKFLRQPIDETRLRELGDAFSQLVFEEIVRCPFVAGAAEFLEKHCENYDLFIASATPTVEMRAIVAQRGLARFFRKVYGSPGTKGQIVRDILGQRSLEPSQAVFIGDALSDYRGAREAGVPFIGRVPASAPNLFPADGTLGVVQDLVDLDDRWSRLVGAIEEQGALPV